MLKPEWQPSASLKTLKARATLLATIRTFFANRKVLEVETPTCSICANIDHTIESLQTRFIGPGYPNGVELYLHTSPEYHMKRLLAADSGSIYQICHAYRDGERGCLHQPEFSMLEWYRLDFNHHQLMDEVASLINAVAPQIVPQQRFSYAELFEHYLELDPHSSDLNTLRATAIALGIFTEDMPDLCEVDMWLDLLLSLYIVPRLPPNQMTFVYDYPALQASMAQVCPDNPLVAERFELYLGNMELANGFHELRDPTEQTNRFKVSERLRITRNQPSIPADHNLIEALEAGLPDCSGVAIGLDRLLMWLIGARHIDEVLAFPL